MLRRPGHLTSSEESVEPNRCQKISTRDTGPKPLNEIKWSRQVTSSASYLTTAPEPELNPGYDADFFADNDTGGFGGDGFGDVDETFADARETFSPGAVDRTSVPEGSQSEEFGSLLRARRARPDYVNYAKTAKKVDVKKLKDNLWSKLDLPEVCALLSPTNNRPKKSNSSQNSLRKLSANLILCIQRKLWRT